MMAMFETRRLILLIVLTVTIICATSETNGRCETNTGDTSHCFVEKIEKSPRTIKHTIRQKSSAVQSVLLKLRHNFIRERNPGDPILLNKTDVSVFCKRGYTGKNCDTCDKGWTGENCDSCFVNFGPPGQCGSCLRGWAGEKCDACARGWTGDNCTICAKGWTGPKCDVCSQNFGPVGQCDSCLTGWKGENCDVCRFGFSTESNCTECIQNGYWKGYIQGSTYLDVHLTFTGETCSELVLGTPMRYHTADYTVSDGYLDEANEKLRFVSNNGNIIVTFIYDDKSLRHTGNNLNLTYMGMP